MNESDLISPDVPLCASSGRSSDKQEIRVFEFVHHLNTFGVRASRPALEWALKTLGREFRIRKRRGEKVAWKGASTTQRPPTNATNSESL